MIGYTTLGTNDLERATAFYDALLADLGARRAWSNERAIAWGFGKDKPTFGVIKPYDGKAATGGNGTMISLMAPSREKVEQLYAKALQLGAKDEGAPGPRTPTFYGAYFRDLDGNKLCIFTMAS